MNIQKDIYMSLLNELNKNNVITFTEDQLIDAFQASTGLKYCFIIDGVFHVNNEDYWHWICLTTDELELIMGADSAESKAVGIKGVKFHAEVKIIANGDTKFNKDIVINTEYAIDIDKDHKISSATIRGLNINSHIVNVESDDVHITDSIIHESIKDEPIK